MVRGGSWNNDNPENLRVAHRNNNNPGNRNNNVGFRVGAPAPQHSLSGSYKLQTRVLDFTESRRAFGGVPINLPGLPKGRPKSEVPRLSLVAPQGMSVMGGVFL